MPSTSDPVATSRDIRRLVIAVWALVIAVAIHGAVSIGGLFVRPMLDHEPRPASILGGQVDDHEGFADWPIDRQIETATVIARTEQRLDGDEVVETVAEIIKQAPDVDFYYAVGDEFSRRPAQSFDRDSNTEGFIQFFVGPTARSRYGIGYGGDRIGRSGMSLDLLREKAAQP